MKKLFLLLAFPATLWSQSFDFDPGYWINFQVGTNFLMAPTRLNDFPETGDPSFEPWTAYTLGITGRIEASPLTTPYGDYAYFNEFSGGMLMQGTSFYNHWGHRLHVGYNELFLELEFSRRYLKVGSYSFEPSGRDGGDEQLYYSNYSDIKRTGIGVQWRFSEDDRLSLGYYTEDFRETPADAPWSGMYLYWVHDKGFGLEIDLSWDHIAYGGVASQAVVIPDDLPKTGFFLNTKLTYQFQLQNSYSRQWREIVSMNRKGY